MITFNPKKHTKDRRVRPTKTKPSFINGKVFNPPNPPGQNRHERRMLKARERMLPSFSRNTRANFIKDIQAKQHKEAIKNKIAKSVAKRIAREKK